MPSGEATLNHVLVDGIATSLADVYNVGILFFLVILGILVVSVLLSILIPKNTNHHK